MMPCNTRLGYMPVEDIWQWSQQKQQTLCDLNVEEELRARD